MAFFFRCFTKTVLNHKTLLGYDAGADLSDWELVTLLAWPYNTLYFKLTHVLMPMLSATTLRTRSAMFFKQHFPTLRLVFFVFTKIHRRYSGIVAA